MFQLLKGISSKVYLVVAVILIISTVFFYKSYTGSLVENGSLQTNNATLQQNVEHVEKSAHITDDVVNRHVTATKQLHEANEVLRKEVLNEYVNKIEPPVKPSKPAATSIVPDGADRVGVLADRLHENYCRSRPEDARCNTIGTPK